MRRLNAALRPVYLVPLLCFGFYSGFLLNGQVRTAPNQFNYLREMAQAFLSGRVDIQCPPKSRCHDLALKDGKYYFYHATPAAFVFMPLVKIWGQETPDSLIAAIIGAGNVFLLILLLARVRASVKPDGSRREILAAELRARALHEDWWFALLWGLGTVQFYISMQGTVWHMAQTLAQSFLLIAALFIFSQSAQRLVFSGFFFALAAYTRNDTVLGGLFFLSVILAKAGTRRAFLRNAAFFSLPFAVLTILGLFYNYARFGNPWEIGISYMQLEVQSGVAARVAAVGKFSLLNLGENIYQQLLRPPALTATFPFIQMDPHGFGILWATPAYLLLIPLAWRMYKRYYDRLPTRESTVIATGALLSAGAIALFLFLLSGHGFMQYAARYTLDLQLFVFVGMFLLMPTRPMHRGLAWTLLAVSMYMQFSGALLFTEFFRRAAGVP